MKKSNKPKKRWATRFKKNNHKSKKKLKGPQTHLMLKGFAPKTVEKEENKPEDNPLIQGAQSGLATHQVMNKPQPVAPTVQQNQGIRTTGRGG